MRRDRKSGKTLSSPFSRVKITFEGLNTVRVLERLRKKGIVVTDVKKDGRNCSLTCKSADRVQVVAILTESLYNITDIEEFGLSAKIEILPFVLGIIVFLSAVFFANLFAFRAEYDVKTENAVALSEAVNGVFPVLKTEIDIDKIKQSVMANPRFTDCEATIVGGTLYVRAESAKPSEQLIDDGKSRFRGVITSVVVLSGTANCKAGDAVNVGDELILPFVKSEKHGTAVYAAPRGIVCGEAVVTASRTIFRRSVDFSDNGMTVVEEDVADELEFAKRALMDELSLVYGDKIISESFEAREYNDFVLLTLTRKIETVFCGG